MRTPELCGSRWASRLYLMERPEAVSTGLMERGLRKRRRADLSMSDSMAGLILDTCWAEWLPLPDVRIKGQ